MTKNQSIRRILPIFLAVALMLTLFTGITTAADYPVTVNDTLSVLAIQTAIQSAISQALPGDTVTVICDDPSGLSNVNTTLTLTIPAGVSVNWYVPFYVGSANPLIYVRGNGTFEVSGGSPPGWGYAWLSNIGAGNTINANGTSVTIIVTDDAFVAANSGSAIDANGTSATVIVKNNASVANDAITNIRPAIHMSNIKGFDTKIIIDNGSVAATTLDETGYAIQTYGNVEIKGNSKVFANPGNGRAVNALGTHSEIIISDHAKVYAVSGIAIRTNSDNASIIVMDNASVYNEGANDSRSVIYMQNGGIVTVKDDGKVEAMGRGTAIKTDGDVIVTDNAWVTSMNGLAINSSGTVDVDGGFVFSYGTNVTGNPNSNKNVINVNNDDSLIITDHGIVVAWDNLNPGPFEKGTSTGIIFNSSSPDDIAVWDIETIDGKEVSGIRYNHGESTGFYPIDGVTVVNLDDPIEPVTSIELVPADMTLTVGDSESLTVTILPDNATNQVVTWESSDEDVASVSSDGTVIGLSVGTSTITVTTVNDLSKTCNVTVTAIPIITAIAGTGGSILPEGDVPVVFDSDLIILITADIGFNISDVLVDGLSQGQISTYTFEEIEEDHTIEALFEPDTTYDEDSFIITAGAGPGGSISPDGEIPVDIGSDLTFFITADSGYDISSVYVDDEDLGPIDEYTFEDINEDHTIEAFFKLSVDDDDGFIITAGAGPGGSISPDGEIHVDSGDSLTFTITADSGYDISAVFVDGMDEGPISTYTFTDIDDDHTIEATFELNDTGNNGNNGGSGGKGGSGTGGATVNTTNTSDKPRENENNGNNSSSGSNTSDTYTVIRNFGQYAGSGSSEGIIDGPVDKFVRLLYKGQEVDPDNYTVTETDGNVVITLKESYVQTFDAGTHTFRAEFTDGYTDLTLTIESGGSDDSGKTGISGMWIWLLLLLLILIILVILYWRWRQASS